MKKQIPAILLAIICAALATTLQVQRNENARLTQRISELETAQSASSAFEASAEATQAQPAAAKAEEAENIPTLADAERVPEDIRAKEQTKRIMSEMNKTISDNPTINKMVEASQRGAIGALYMDMIEYLGLDADETRYFMDLLMYRQMANVDAHLKMASGTLSDEEKIALQESVKRANETTRSEMEKFLNNPEDFEEFKYYEDTIGERMMLSQMDQLLGEDALSDTAYREVLDIMYEVRENYNWSTDLNDNENRDLSSERFSRENIQKHIDDMKFAGELMDQRMQEILTPEQLAAWRESGLAMQALVEGQLMQANQMTGGE